ncbi:MAG: hypothetical protein QXH30_00610, partial [Candidatus Bilamarchaeaceae archaeon]
SSPEGGEISTYRSKVGLLVPEGGGGLGLSVDIAEKRDDYQKGTNLYGAVFGWNGMSFDAAYGEYPLLPFISEVGAEFSSEGEERPYLPSVNRPNAESFEDFYSKNHYTSDDAGRFLPFYYSWTNDDAARARTVFLTSEDDPHNIYPWLLRHHSVYSQQIEDQGHAEFECSGSEECLSGYCSVSEYQRGSCIKYIPNEDRVVEVDCDCRETPQGVVCRGTRDTDVPAWDNPDEEVRIGVTMSAPISYYDDVDDTTANAESITSVPSLGAVVKLNEEIPYFIMPLGGSGAPKGRSVTPEIGSEDYMSPTDLEGGPIVLPTYNSLTKDYMREVGGWDSNYCGFMQYVINPTSAGMMYAPAAEEGQPSAPLPPSCQGGLWAMGEDCMVHMSACMGGECGAATVNTICYSDLSSGLSNPVVYGYTHWLFDESVTGYICHPSVPYESCDEGVSCLNCEPQEHGEYCMAQDFQYQMDRFFPKILRECNVERVSVNLCFSKSASEEYGLPPGFRHFETTFWWVDKEQPGFQLADDNMDICDKIRSLEESGDEDPAKLAAYKRAVCYQWASGGRKPASDEDVCVAEALAFLVVVPEVLPADAGNYSGRYALGDCIFNSRNDDLEVKTYGICEGCGYLTMAKEHIVALPEDSGNPGYDTNEFDHSEMYGNAYCPDMVVHTPFSTSALQNGISLPGTGLYDWRFYMLAPEEQEGSVRVEYGSNDFGTTGDPDDQDMCIYPNGYIVFDDEEDIVSNAQRGLPQTLPNAFYINRKLESLMKRNVQPVLFADDAGLWRENIESGDDEGSNLLVLKLDDEENAEWATAELLKELYLQRPDLFIEYQGLIKQDSYFTMRGSFLANTLLNEGGAILVLKVAGSQDDDFQAEAAGSCAGENDGECIRKIQGDIYRRGVSTRLLCPNCMTSVAFGYEENGTSLFNSSARFEQIARVFRYRGANGEIITDPGVNASCYRKGSAAVSCDADMLKYVDVISVKLVLQDGDSYCSAEGIRASKFDLALEGIAQIGRNSLQRYSKPVIITDFIIKRGECWSEEEAGEFMAYLGTKASTLAKSGVIGIIYGDWESPASRKTGIRYEYKDGVYSYRGDFYDGVSIAARNFAGFKFQTFFNEVPVTESCPCEPCDSEDDPAICNGHFKGVLSAPLCEGYEKSYGKPVKWQEGCITQDVCMNEENLNQSTIICDVRYNNGTREKITFLGSDIAAYPSVYKDVISAINRPGAVGGSYVIIPNWTLENTIVGAKTGGGGFGTITLGVGGGGSSSQEELGNPPLGGGSAADFLGQGVQIGKVAHGSGVTLGDVGLIPCFQAGELNISYTTISSPSFGATPAVFPLNGDPRIACDPVEGAAEICGYVPPIIDYIMDCTIVNPNYPPAFKEECSENAYGPCFSDEDCPCDPWKCQWCDEALGYCRDPVVE